MFRNRNGFFKVRLQEIYLGRIRNKIIKDTKAEIRVTERIVKRQLFCLYTQ